jgi:hypothetical protein
MFDIALMKVNVLGKADGVVDLVAGFCGPGHERRAKK